MAVDTNIGLYKNFLRINITKSTTLDSHNSTNMYSIKSSKTAEVIIL